MPDFLKFSEFGLAGIVIGVLLFFIWRIIVWAMAWFKDQTEKLDAQAQRWATMFKEQIDNAEKERDKWHTLHECHQAFLTKIIESIDRHDEKAQERGHYVREEHKKFLENQELIKAGLEKVNMSLGETEKALGRINGYKG